ncbi:MAG: hypothetical protein V3T72_17690 [Thermoanaerobaculia bacterium]
MTTLFTLTFQGQVEAAGPLQADDERRVARAAFPLSPPRDAAVRDGYRAFKMAPLESGRVLLSAVANRGDRDRYQRPVLRAVGCVLEPAEMAAALRDPAAVWEALEGCEIGAGAEAFERRVSELSIHTAPAAFERFRSTLERSGAFHARLAAALDAEAVDLYLGSAAGAAEKLQPALGLLPLKRLRRLHLAIGGERSELREPVLGLIESAPESVRKGRGLLSGLFGKKEAQEAVAVDFAGEEVFGSRPAGAIGLAAAIADQRPWPVALPELDRYQVLLECLDRGRSLFEILPELEELRRAVRRFEDLSEELAPRR